MPAATSVISARGPINNTQSGRSWAASRAAAAPAGGWCSSLWPARWPLCCRAGGPGPAAAGSPLPLPLPPPGCTWHPLQAAWEASEAEALAALAAAPSPAWRVLLLSDGSVTRHLQLWTGAPVTVECLEMRPLGPEGAMAAALPPDAAAVSSELLQRQVLLRVGGDGPAAGAALCYAASWWDASTVSDYLTSREAPIWSNLAAARTELYRDIRTVYHGRQPHLERAFGCSGPFWGRHYVFWHGGRPLTVIYEVFSNRLAHWLGDTPTR